MCTVNVAPAQRFKHVWKTSLSLLINAHAADEDWDHLLLYLRWLIYTLLNMIGDNGFQLQMGLQLTQWRSTAILSWQNLVSTETGTWRHTLHSAVAWNATCLFRDVSGLQISYTICIGFCRVLNLWSNVFFLYQFQQELDLTRGQFASVHLLIFQRGISLSDSELAAVFYYWTSSAYKFDGSTHHSIHVPRQHHHTLNQRYPAQPTAWHAPEDCSRHLRLCYSNLHHSQDDTRYRNH